MNADESTVRDRSHATAPSIERGTDAHLCSVVCGARCCQWGFPEVTAEEAELLKKRAQEMGLPEPEIVEYLKETPGAPSTPKTGYVMHATPCVFLGKDKLCSIYPDRPKHCQDFPDASQEWCPLSWKLFPKKS